MLYRLLRADRQIAQQHVGARGAERFGDVGRSQVRRTKGLVVGIVGHMGGHAIELRAGLDDHVGDRQRALENSRAIGLGEDRFLERMADLAPINVEGRDEFDIGTGIAADGGAHDTVERGVATGAVILYALDQRAGAVADAGDGDLDLFHEAQDSVELEQHYRAGEGIRWVQPNQPIRDRMRISARIPRGPRRPTDWR